MHVALLSVVFHNLQHYESRKLPLSPLRNGLEANFKKLDRQVFIPLQNECFRGYTGISLSVHPFMCPSVYKILVSVKGLVGVLSHI